MQRYLDHGITVVSLAGDLTWRSAPAARRAVLKSLAECPRAVVVDLGGLDDVSHLVVPMLLNLEWHACQEPAVALLPCEAAPSVSAALCRAGLSGLRCGYATRNEVIETAARDGPTNRWIGVRLGPTPYAVAEARCLVGDACLAWNLHHLLHPARLVTSELAQNAAEHARTDIEVIATLRQVYLHIRIRDGSRAQPYLRDRARQAAHEPLADRGRGLALVAATAAAWGFRLTSEGKVVWATLASRSSDLTSRS